MLERWWPWLLGVFALSLVALLFEALRALARDLSYAALLDAIQHTPASGLVLAVLATGISYLTLTGYDRSALRYVGAALPYRVMATTSFIAYALGNTIGLGVLTGGAVRMRMYAAAGLDPAQIPRVIAFNAAAFGIGIAVVGAMALLWDAAVVAPALHAPALMLQIPSVALLVAAAGLVYRCRDRRECRLPGNFGLHLPTATLAVQQLALSALDIAASAAVLWFLLPPGTLGFAPFVGFYAIAVVAGAISHVPGGLGVFEAIMLVALAGRVPTEQLAGALVLYRLIYHVLPLLLALALLLSYEMRHGVPAPLARAVASVSPLLLSAYTLIVGVVLLVSGATPQTDEAAELLAQHVPLPLVEAAHFLGSIAGLGLLLVARGMLMRLDAAWWAGLVIALLSLVLALPKGIAISEALLLGFLAITLAGSRREFTRRASLLAQPFSGGWLVAMGVIVAATTAILLFAYRDVDYGHELWWQFEFDAQAPRSLRALVAVTLIAAMLAIRQLLRSPVSVLDPPTAAELDRAAAIVRAQDRAEACLALSGDKHFLFSESGRAFLMFGWRGRSWIGLFDPVGPEQEWPELVWRLIERAREQGGRACFYQVRPQTLALYLDAGLRVYKLGEEAQVDLGGFSLQGRSRQNLRSGVNRAEREGLAFEVLTAEAVAERMQELRAVSDAWLGEHRTAEKGFSLGAFDEAYLRRQPVAIVRHGQRLVAFATLLSTDRKVEASVDLMRHLPDAPKGTMDFLFARLMLHFQAQGFRRFGLGMAPLSGMAEHPLAPRWHRFGRLVFGHGEHFYNFQGLRAFKEKFSPVWEARYLAAPGGVTPLLVLTDTAALIGGGLRRVIAK